MLPGWLLEESRDMTNTPERGFLREETGGARLVAEEVNPMEMRSTPLAPFALSAGLCGRHKEMDDATKRQGRTRL
jgi:hypothetical protein